MTSTDFRMPPPPKPRKTLPTDPFEAWMAKQAAAGHDRQWLEHNRPALAERFKRDQTDLRLLSRQTKAKGRYEEL